LHEPIFSRGTLTFGAITTEAKSEEGHIAEYDDDDVVFNSSGVLAYFNDIQLQVHVRLEIGMIIILYH
jgi:hypothetical protein